MKLTKEQIKVRGLFRRLLRTPAVKFPAKHGKLIAPEKRGVYVIYSPSGKVMHVGGTPRGKLGLFQRLRDHMAGNSSFTHAQFNKNGSLLRRGYSFRCVIVANQRQRVFLEAYAIGSLCPKHVGLGELRAEGKVPSK